MRPSPSLPCAPRCAVPFSGPAPARPPRWAGPARAAKRSRRPRFLEMCCRNLNQADFPYECTSERKIDQRNLDDFTPVFDSNDVDIGSKVYVLVDHVRHTLNALIAHIHSPSAHLAAAPQVHTRSGRDQSTFAPHTKPGDETSLPPLLYRLPLDSGRKLIFD